MPEQVPKNFRTVVVTGSLGNIIEWYDFYILRSLAVSVFRPLGALLFGWLGDRVGRKYTFLITLMGMAIGTEAIGLVPTFDQIGFAAAVILLALRMVQGLCLGGQYGGAITYVAEHVSDEKRGYYTGWLQTSPTLGIVLSLLIIIACRKYFGSDTFNADWGAWRIPFLFSFVLTLIAGYMRRYFQESPIFQEIKAKQGMTKNPWKEAFLSANMKLVLIATIVVLGEGVVWYSSQFWALYYLQTVVKMDVLSSGIIVGVGLLIGAPTLILFGRLSDSIGRKPVILAGFLLAAVTYYPLYLWLGSATQPGAVNYPLAIIIVAILVSYVGMVYGPIGA
ncbi:MAG: MHS family MFS transporter, partial [Gammaproteobacteria bacterium]